MSSNRTLELWAEMSIDIFGVQLYEILMVFLLIILLKGFDFGKCLSINFKNSSPTLVLTFLLKGGLNHVIFLFLHLDFLVDSEAWAKLSSAGAKISFHWLGLKRKNILVV